MKNCQLEKTSETAFDPWGVVLNGLGQQNAFQNRFEMQGKESEKTFGLNRISFGARTFNPTTGVFDGIDPLATTYPHWTPYQYAGNMPINFVDLDGLEPAFYDPQSKNKVPAPISASDRLQQRMPQNATLAISTNQSLFPQNDKSDKIINGSINATMGVVGMIASTAYMVETVGAGAAVGGASAFSLAFGETAIGLAQVADGLGNNGKTEILHNVSSTPGLVGASAGMSAENVGKLDAFSQLLPGLITGGNLVGIVQTPQKIRNASTTSERAFQTLNGVDALLDYTGAVKATQNDNNVSKSDQVTKTRANELINFIKKLPNEK